MRILDALTSRRNALNVGQIVAASTLSRAAVAHHLRALAAVQDQLAEHR